MKRCKKVEKALNIGGIAGYVGGESQKCKIVACLSEHGNAYLTVGPSDKPAETTINYAGGIVGHLNVGEVLDCFYICQQVGVNSVNSNPLGTRITTAQKNNGATIASVTLSSANGGATLTNKYLYEVLYATGKHGSLPITRGDDKVTTYWTSVSYSSEIHAVPTMLKELGTDFYLN